MTSIPAPTSSVTVERVQVWDLPTRLFHWSLAGLLVLSWFTGEEEGTAALVHRLSGEAVAGLIVFRVIWGFVGGEHARFSDFIKGPGAVARHLAHLMRGRADPAVGHNPLGGLSVLVLLLAVGAVVVTGLFSAGDDGRGGPLAGQFAWELSELHEPAFRILQALVVLHLVGVAVTSLASRENLIGAMVSGLKRRRLETHVSHARRASVAALLVALAAGAAASGLLMSLPHPNAGGQEVHAGDPARPPGAGLSDACGVSRMAATRPDLSAVRRELPASPAPEFGRALAAACALVASADGWLAEEERTQLLQRLRLLSASGVLDLDDVVVAFDRFMEALIADLAVLSGMIGSPTIATSSLTWPSLPRM